MKLFTLRVDIEDFWEDVEDDEIVDEVKHREIESLIVTRKDKELDILAHLNHGLMENIYKYLADNCHTYDEIMRLEEHLKEMRYV